MTDKPGRMGQRRPAFVRYIRWQPRTYAVVWLLAAAQALVTLAGIPVLDAITHSPPSLVWVVSVGFLAVGNGLIGSYYLNQRRKKFS